MRNTRVRHLHSPPVLQPFPDYRHPYPYTVFANIVGFALVFRTNVSYNRYWEGITHLRQMSSKWGDAATEVLSYDWHLKGVPSSPRGDDPSAPPEQEASLESTHTLFCALITHR